jgi:hypothetical protein
MAFQKCQAPQTHTSRRTHIPVLGGSTKRSTSGGRSQTSPTRSSSPQQQVPASPASPNSSRFGFVQKDNKDGSESAFSFYNKSQFNSKSTIDPDYEKLISKQTENEEEEEICEFDTETESVISND